MSIKYFCDQCKAELSPAELNRLTAKRGDLSIEVIHSWKGSCNGGNICHGCIRDTITRGTSLTQRTQHTGEVPTGLMT